MRLTQVMNVITTKLSHGQRTFFTQKLGLGLFRKLYNGQMTTAVMYMSTASTLMAIRSLSKRNGKSAKRRQMVHRMMRTAKIKQME